MNYIEFFHEEFRLPKFTPTWKPFNAINALAYKTLLTQEMLKNGYLAGTRKYARITHTKEIMEYYFKEIDNT